jgi:putative tryptophan/tyrosine transport system substrate-binding protein
MKRRIGICLLTSVLLTTVSFADAQQRKKVARVGYLGNTASGEAVSMQPLRERLRELGYTEGQDITIEHRYWEGQVERLPELATELVRLNCDVIVTSGTEAAQAAKNTIKTVPVVMAFGGDALRRGIVADLARPGGNITGLTSVGTELEGKRLELLKEIVPKLSRVAFLWSPTNPGVDFQVKEIETMARSIRLELQSIEVKGPDDFDAAFRLATNKRAGALLVSGGGFFAFHQKRILELGAKSRLPAMYNNTRYVEAGGLMTYAYDRPYQFRRAAEYVDKILKGAKPADLPVERPKKFELVINLKTANQIGLTIPQSVLYRADKVIK